MTPEGDENSIQRAAQLIKAARHVVVLTGAGVSTHSGIPDFRSQETGLWQRDDPMQVASLSTFRRNPQRFFNWLRPLAASMWQAQPNAAHIALAQLESGGYVQAVITQNIDGLHQRAGSRQVLEVHGSMETLSCIPCHRVYLKTDFITPFIVQGEMPRCPVCSAILKPDIVLFEEMLSQDTWLQAEHLCQQADVMVVIGSSLQVIPAGHLPALARENGAQLIIINYSPTYLDSEARVLIREDLVNVIPAIYEGVIKP